MPENATQESHLEELITEETRGQDKEQESAPEQEEPDQETELEQEKETQEENIRHDEGAPQ